MRHQPAERTNADHNLNHASCEEQTETATRNQPVVQRHKSEPCGRSQTNDLLTQVILYISCNLHITYTSNTLNSNTQTLTKQERRGRQSTILM